MILKFLINNIATPIVTSVIAQPLIEAVVWTAKTGYRVYKCKKTGKSYVEVDMEDCRQDDVLYSTE